MTTSFHDVTPIIDAFAEAHIYKVGDKVRKVSGDYQLDGEVRAVFATKRNKIRYVVEHDPGFLHIYNGAQLEKRDAKG